MRAEPIQPIAPPCSIAAEQSVLGALLIDQGAWARIEGKLSAADFYQPSHRILFDAIVQLVATARAADPVTVTELLKQRGELNAVGGPGAVAKLAQETPNAANIETYAEVVCDRSLLRQLQQAGIDIARSVTDRTDEDGRTLVSRALERLLGLHAAASSRSKLVSSQQLAGEFLYDLDRRRDAPQGLHVGLADFDQLTHGLEPGDLVVIAGRPSMGKTALLVTIAAHVSGTQPVAVFSAEMPARHIVRRGIALVGNIPQERLRRAEPLTDADWNVITPAATVLAERRLWIDDSSRPSLTHIRAECLALKARAGLGLVLIDFVQLVQGTGSNRYEQLHDVAFGFKALAKDLAVPVILLAQLNRGVEVRDEKRPHLSDLRDSGAIEEAADIVGMLYCEGYYDPNFGMPYVLECHIEKHRNGERRECLWRLAGACSEVSVLEPGARAQYLQLRAKEIASRRARSAHDL